MKFIKFNENIIDINNFISLFWDDLSTLIENIDYIIINYIDRFKNNLKLSKLDEDIKSKLNSLNKPINLFYDNFKQLKSEYNFKTIQIHNIIKEKEKLKKENNKQRLNQELNYKSLWKNHISKRNIYFKNKEKIYNIENLNLNFTQKYNNYDNFKKIKNTLNKLDDDNLIKYFNFNNSFQILKTKVLEYKNLNLEYYSKLTELDNQIFGLLLNEKNIYEIKYNFNKEILLCPFPVHLIEKYNKNNIINFSSQKNIILSFIKKNNELLDDSQLIINDLDFRENLLKNIFYFFYYQDSNHNFNFKNISIIEELLIDIIPFVFPSNDLKYEKIFYILYIIYNIFTNPLNIKKNNFSDKFLILIKGIDILYTENFWSNLILFIIDFLSKSDNLGYYNDTDKNIRTNNYKLKIKYPFNSFKKILKFVIYTAYKIFGYEIFSFFKIILSNNLKYKYLKNNDLYYLLIKFEKEYNKKYDNIDYKNNKQIFNKKNFNLSTKRSNKLKFIFKKSFPFLSNFNFFKLSKKINLEKGLLKYLLLKPNLNKETRIKIYKYKFLKINYKEINDILLEDHVKKIIKLDWNRTNFNQDKNILNEILTQISTDFPPLLYYQGMNCIVAFLYNYFQDKELSKNIFYLIIQNGIVQYLSNNFKKINLLLYIFELSIKCYFPWVDDHLINNNINLSIFIVPWILTLFTNYEFIKNNIDIIDIYLAYSWKGVIKIILLIIKYTKNKLLEIKKENLLIYLNKEILVDFSKFDINLKKEIRQFKISNNDISFYESKFYYFRNKFENFWHTNINIKN